MRPALICRCLGRRRRGRYGSRADTAGLSERYVNELLFEAGASFTTRLTELRLRKAAELLVHREGRISDIAFACGFNDLSYFNRCFRRRFGLTPTAARGK